MSTGTPVTVACVQLAPVIGDAAQSIARIDAGIAEAVNSGAQIIVLPELANTGYVFASADELRSAAQPLDGPYVEHLVAAASEFGVVIASGFAEIGADDRMYNSAVIVGRGGVIASYRKAHLWNTEKTCGFRPGSQPPPVVDTEYGRLGLMICYDLEFPEWVRAVALEGAELLCAPVNWPLYPRPDGERPGEIVRVQADSAVNRMYIAAADRVGLERDQDWLGGTVIVDADGYPVTPIHLGAAHIAVATIDLALARDKSISPRNDVHTDRRPELYG
ncbi:MAG TPA: nitrilase-related carbon-nitrogen hydrolase [Pseudolysinimonas sp.]|nr:nitrilase-related carbon-nitrogen hydrolase [Pseudolysinimonas sp.]